MKILAIDTSCDETSASVTEGTNILSNIVWSQASLHAKFGGVMPSLAQRMHEERIDWVIDSAIQKSKVKMQSLDAIAVTVGPGLSIALGVGIDRAKKLAKEFKKPIIQVNHIEAHLLSPLIRPLSPKNLQAKIRYPAYGLVVSGGNTIFVLIEKIGQYKVLAQTVDDALGEALDKGARMLELGYPGGAVLEKMALSGDPGKFFLPIPLIGQESRQIFSYSGLKTSFLRLIKSNKDNKADFPSKKELFDLAAAYQDIAFKHVERIIAFAVQNSKVKSQNFLLGGGVAANIELRRRLRKLGRKYAFKLMAPYSKKLCGDNAAMVGVCAHLNPKYIDPDKIDRRPNLKIGD